ncbi:Rieske (2Fe-2S) protein [Streptomyces spinosirectus]|jgi:Rieske Fe-S protein|uniref:Rieske (2Fe-2S) protein n=1 Tax=Streptomyces TaxID=1883 RepID=UPI000D3BB4BE|nr:MULTISPECIES: Rieske (2Fe-2S) protein [Streptomyces]MBY8344716.1 Rieske (2Fe-2S) protein [Streptomyces plumbidurans]PTM94904.1 Rieske-like 2Fe-2S protein [Streptomyces sp. VMFN-G11Ma]UIR17175.1 Rieske (2Fe-2S) protein [Streptomyces spinosirectus]
MTHRSTRRTVLLATGAATLAAGCSNYGDNNDSGSSSVNASSGQELAKTSDIPVGGGKIFKDEKVVVTQPKKGEFKAFSAICTHQGCTVSAVADGTINCPCHGSKYKVADGSVARGPAPKPLAEQQIKVKGNSISLA